MRQHAFASQQKRDVVRSSGPQLVHKSHERTMAPVAPSRTHHDFSAISLFSAGSRQASCPLATPRSCPFGGACHACPVRVQTQLKVGQPDNVHEREASHMADEVTRMTGAAGRGPAERNMLRRAPLESGASGAGGMDITPQAEAHIRTLGAGRALPDSERSYFEPRFGRDLGFVRIHTDERAAEAAAAVNARAFCMGRDIVFGRGEWASDTPDGKKLMAHEITHALQDQSSDGTFLQRTARCDQWNPVNDTTTQRLIDDAMAWGNQNVEMALLRIIGQRNASDTTCCDLNYAAADHYIFARSLTASGYPLVLVLGLIYGYALTPRLRVLETGACPVSPFDSDVNAWAVQGAWDGRIDWEAAHPMRPINPDQDASTYGGFGAFK